VKSFTNIYFFIELDPSEVLHTVLMLVSTEQDHCNV